MFNEELKIRFIQYSTHLFEKEKSILTVFSQCEKYEVENNADVCTFSAEKLKLVLNHLGMHSRAARFSEKADILTQYFNWCIREGVPGAQNVMDEAISQYSETVKSQYVLSPLHLQIYLDKLFEPEDKKTADNNYRCFCWFAFIGIDIKDVLDIKVTDVDFDNMAIHYKGKELPIYRESLKALRNCVTLTEFVYDNPNYKSIQIRDRVAGDTVIRGFRETLQIKTIRSIISRTGSKLYREGKTNLKLDYAKIQRSGIFYRAYESERVGIAIDNEYFFNALGGVGSRVVSNPTTQAAMKLAKDYKQWKLAYSL